MVLLPEVGGVLAGVDVVEEGAVLTIVEVDEKEVVMTASCGYSTLQ